MSITIELAPEVEAQLRKKAQERGQEPQGYAAQVLTDGLRREQEEPEEADSSNAPGPVMLDKMLAGRIGTFHSGGSDVARDGKRLFGEHLEEKRRQGRL